MKGEPPVEVWYLEWEQEESESWRKGIWVKKRKAFFKRAHMVSAMRIHGRRNFMVLHTSTRWVHVPEDQFEQTLGIKT